RLAVTNAPADVACLRVDVAGSRNVTRQFDIAPGQSTVFTLTGLPLGNDTFTEQALAVACSQMADAGAANWASDPTTALVRSGVVTDLTIVLRRNGMVKVTSDFQDDPDAGGCAPAEGACLANTDCCDGNPCVGGRCLSVSCPAGQQFCVRSPGGSCINVSSDV